MGITQFRLLTRQGITVTGQLTSQSVLLVHTALDGLKTMATERWVLQAYDAVIYIL